MVALRGTPCGGMVSLSKGRLRVCFLVSDSAVTPSFLPCLSLSPLPYVLTGGCSRKEMLPVGREHRGGERNVSILTWLHVLGCLEAQPCPLRPRRTCFLILQGGALLSAPSVGSLPLGPSMGCLKGTSSVKPSSGASPVPVYPTTGPTFQSLLGMYIFPSRS